MGIDYPAGGSVNLQKQLITYTAGTITAPNNSAWTTLGAGDITLSNLGAGVWVLAGFICSTASLVAFRSFDIATKPGGVLTNQLSTSVAVNNAAAVGMAESDVTAGNSTAWVGSTLYKVVGGDLVGGALVLSLITFGSGSDVIHGTATAPITFWATTLGS